VAVGQYHDEAIEIGLGQPIGLFHVPHVIDDEGVLEVAEEGQQIPTMVPGV